MESKGTAIGYALLAAVFYAVNTPVAKILLEDVPAALMAAFLYLGAGTGVGVLYLFRRRSEDQAQRLTRADLPYTIGMIVLDIFAPIFLMLGVGLGTASNASLLSNFEIAATTLIALLLFKETVTKRLWLAILLITLASMLLSLEGGSSFQFSCGSLLVLLAAVCWGLENNCTRKISERSTYQIVILKGLLSGGGALLIALVLGERLPGVHLILMAMLLGFVSYGLSIFAYIRAQRSLGAAKTSAYYAAAPFIGALLSFVLLGEPLTRVYLLALALMLAGTLFVVRDTMANRHTHPHTHEITHTHDGVTHTHTITHTHSHEHSAGDERHAHPHSAAEMEEALQRLHCKV